MSGQRSGLSAAPQWKFDKYGVNNASGDFTKGISVEEKKGSAAMTV